MNASTREVLNGVADCIPEGAVRVDSDSGRDRLWLPKPAAADYGIYVETHEQKRDATIAALPTGALEPTSFWHLPLEYSPEDEPAALRVLVGELRRLILYRSRITQKGGFLLWRLRCEVDVQGDWQRLGGTIAYPRLFLVPPRAFRLTASEYHSRALREAV